MSYLALKSVNEVLADIFKNEKDLEALNKKFLQAFWESYSRLPCEGRRELEKFSILGNLAAGKIPEDDDYQNIIDSFDDIYFDANEDGDKEKSNLFFRLARFVSAIHFYNLTGAEDRYMSAVYEAVFSAEDSKKFSQEMIGKWLPP